MVKFWGGKRGVIHSGIFDENVCTAFFLLCSIWAVGSSGLVCKVWRHYGVVQQELPDYYPKICFTLNQIWTGTKSKEISQFYFWHKNMKNSLKKPYLVWKNSMGNFIVAFLCNFWLFLLSSIECQFFRLQRALDIDCSKHFDSSKKLLAKTFEAKYLPLEGQISRKEKNHHWSILIEIFLDNKNIQGENRIQHIVIWVMHPLKMEHV